jgi:signal transduction histidine kinase
MALQTKLAIFLITLLFFLTLQWALFIGHEQRLLTEEAVERASILARTLAESSREPLVSIQISRLENYIDSIHKEKDVVYARIVNDSFKVIADTRVEEEGWTYSGRIAETVETRFKENLLVARAPIQVLGKTIGMAELAFSLNPMRDKINNNRMNFLEMLFFQLLIGFGFSLLLQIQIIRPLKALSDYVTVLPPETERYDIRIPKFASPEIGQMIAAVNKMRNRLVDFQKEALTETQFVTIGKLAANMAHEIRNPLEAISGAVELIRTDVSMSKESTEYLEIIRDEIRILNEYLSNFLTFTRSEPSKPVLMNINRLIDETVILMTPLIKKHNLSIVYNDDQRPLFCNGDTNQLKRVLLNIILNSVEACTEGNRIWIVLEMDNNYGIINIFDNGSGIPPEIIPKIFDPYFTTRVQI